MATIDNLSIAINANATNASTSLDKLAKSLKNMSQVVRGLEGGKLNGVSKSIGTLATAMNQMSNIKKPDYNRLVKGLSAIGGLDSSKLQAVGNALTPLANSINTFSNVNFSNKGVTNLINALTRLSNANVSATANADFTKLGNQIVSLSQQLGQASKVETNTIQFTNAIARLASSGAKAYSTSRALPQLATNLNSLFTTMSKASAVTEGTVQFTNAIGILANAGAKAQQTAAGLGTLATELKSFMQTMSTAPEVSQNVISMTQALGQLASNGKGVNQATNGLATSLNRLSSSSNKLKGAVGSIKNFFANLKNGSKSAAISVNGLTSAIGMFYAKYFLLFRAIKGIGSMIETASQLTEVQNVVDVTFGNAVGKMEEFASASIETMGMSELATKKIASRFQAMGSAIGISSSQISSSMDLINDKFANTEGTAYTATNSMSDISLNLTRLAADMASFYDITQEEVAEDLQSIFTGQTKPLRQYGLDLTEATLKEWALKNGLDADIQSMTQAEKVMLRYQYVMSQTSAAQGDFERTSGTWANQARILKMQLQALATTIGQTFINALKPGLTGLNKFMSGVLSVTKKIADALGAIFGWTFEFNEGGTTIDDDLSDVEDGLSGIGDDADSATDSVKELKNELMGFDEINKLSDDTSSGKKGGSGSDTGTNVSGLDTAMVQTNGSLIKKYESEIDSLYGLGRYISDTLSNSLESIDWQSIYSKAINFGTGLAQYLNGLITPRLFYDLGKTISNSINTAFKAKNAFAISFDFANLGLSIARGINGFFQNIDWETALSSAKNWGKGVGTTLTNFLRNTDFKSIGKTLANQLNLDIVFFFESSNAFDWTALGTAISDSINSFFSTLDFKMAVETFNNIAKGILDALITAVDNVDWNEIGNSIGTFLSGVDWGEILVKAITLTLKLGEALAKAFASSFDSAPIETSLLTLFALINFNPIGKLIGTKIGSIALQSLLSNLTSGVGTTVASAATSGATTTGAAAAGSTLGATIGGAITSTLTAVAPIALVGGVAAGATALSAYGIDKYLGNNSAVHKKFMSIMGDNYTFSIDIDTKQAQQASDDLSNAINDMGNSVKKVQTGEGSLSSLDNAIGLAITKQNELKDSCKGMASQYENIRDKVNTYINELTDADAKQQLYNDGILDQNGKITDLQTAYIYLTEHLSTDSVPANNAINDLRDSLGNMTETDLSELQESYSAYTEELESSQSVIDATTDYFSDMVRQQEIATGQTYTYMNAVTEQSINVKKATKDMEKASADYEEYLEDSLEQDENYWNSLSNTVSMIAERNKQSLDDMSQAQADYETDLQDSLEQDEDYWSDFSSNAKMIFQNTKDDMIDIANEQANGIDNALDRLSNVGSDVGESIANGFENETNDMPNLFERVVDRIKSLTDFDFSLPHIPLPHFDIKPDGWEIGDLLHGSIPYLDIDWYASGGLVDTPTLFGAGEAGPEWVGSINGHSAVANQDQMTDVLYNATKQGVVDAMAVANNNVTVVLQGDASKFFKSMQTQAKNYTIQTGKAAF